MPKEDMMSDTEKLLKRLKAEEAYRFDPPPLSPLTFKHVETNERQRSQQKALQDWYADCTGGRQTIVVSDSETVVTMSVDLRRTEELAKKWRPFFDPLIGLKHGSPELQEALVKIVGAIHLEWLGPKRKWLEQRENWTLEDCLWRDGEE